MAVKILLAVLGSIAALLVIAAFIVVFMTAPRKASKKAAFQFHQSKFAHRGIYDNNDIPENSLSAFQQAIQHGYGIEMDVRLTKDGVPVVFHDDSLRRMCNQTQLVKEIPLNELKSLHLLSTDQTIPTFEEFLRTVHGQVPLLIEFKTGIPGHDVKPLCQAVDQLLKEYSGPYVIESFDYKVLEWYRKHRPTVIRGQLGMGIQCYVPAMGKAAELVSKKQRFMMTHLLYNYLGRPNFIAYRFQDIGMMVRINQALGAKVLCWTVNNLADSTRLLKTYDGVIFEKFLA